MRPFLRDDGTTVTLDLHGLSVAEAERRLVATLREAAARGRRSVRVIHGSSTSDPDGRSRTIKHLVEDHLAEGRLDNVVGSFSTGEATLLSLPVGTPVDRRPIQAGDVF